MSSALFDSEQALAYTAPPYLPIIVAAAGYGEALATPDVWPTVEVTWRFVDRPGVFTSRIGYSSDWHHDMNAAVTVDVFTIQSIYALLGGWPPATPLESYPVTLPPGVIYDPETGRINLPPGVIGIG